MIKKLLYYSCLLTIGLTAMDAVTIVEGLTFGRLAFILMIFLAVFNPKVLIPSKKDEYQTILFIFILFVIITMPFSLYADEVFNRLLLLIQYYLIVVVVSNVVVTHKQIYNMFFAYCLGCLYIAYMMFFTYSNEASIYDEIAFRSETVGNPNENAFLIVYAIIISYILMKNNIYNRKISKILSVFVLLYILAVFTSGSRMGFIIMTLSLVVIFIFEFKFNFKYIFYVFIGMISLYFLVNNYITDSTLERMFNVTNDIESSNLASREDIWANAVTMFNSEDFNWFIGNGWATFPHWYQKYFNNFKGAHNFYISYIYTTGLIGFFIFISYFVCLFKRLSKESFAYYLLLLVPLISMASTNWEYRRWWFLLGLFVYKIKDINMNTDLKPKFQNKSKYFFNDRKN